MEEFYNRRSPPELDPVDVKIARGAFPALRISNDPDTLFTPPMRTDAASNVNRLEPYAIDDAGRADAVLVKYPEFEAVVRKIRVPSVTSIALPVARNC